MPLSYILINVESGMEEEILKELRKIPNVKECHRLYGIYDVIEKVEAESMDALKQIATWTTRFFSCLSTNGARYHQPHLSA